MLQDQVSVILAPGVRRALLTVITCMVMGKLLPYERSVLVALELLDHPHILDAVETHILGGDDAEED